MKKMIQVLLTAAMVTFFLCSQAISMNSPEKGKWRTFHGFVEKMPDGLHGSWIIGGRTVLVTPYSRVEQKHGLGTLGSYAEVWGIERGNTLRAMTVQLEPGGKFLSSEPPGHKHENGYLEGNIQHLPKQGIGFWEVDGHRVLVDKLSHVIEAGSRAVPGAVAAVVGYYRNNTFYARQVVVK